MPSYDKYKKSTYVQKSDVERDLLATIDHVEEADVSMNDQPTEMKFVIHFKENIKPWVPGISMLEMIHHINGNGDVNKWGGTVIVLYLDATVAFRGKIVGGIRCRPPKEGYKVPAQEDNGPPPTDEDVFDKDMREPGEDDGPPEY